MTKENLCRYTLLNGEVERFYKRMAELESTATNSSILEVNNFEVQIETAWAEMRKICNAINSLNDPMERVVLHMRYTDAEIGRLTPWKEIAKWMYGKASEKNMQAVFRLHKRALESIEKVAQ